MAKRGRKGRDSDDESHGSKTHSKYKNREPMDVNLIIEHDEMEADKKNLPCWRSAHAGKASRPARHLCAICGFFADYKCKSCANRRIEAVSSYYCSLACLEVHSETNCGKAVHLTQW